MLSTIMPVIVCQYIAEKLIYGNYIRFVNKIQSFFTDDSLSQLVIVPQNQISFNHAEKLYTDQ